MHINSDQISGLCELYPGNSYSVIKSIFESVFSIGEYQDLTSLINEYLTNLSIEDDGSLIRNNVNNIIYRYVAEEIVAKEYGVILALDKLPDMEFLSGLLEFYVDMRNPESSKYDDNIANLSESENDTVIKLGLIVSDYNSNFHFTDAFYTISSAPMSVVDKYLDIMTTVRERYTNADSSLKDMFSLVMDINQDLLSTRMFTYLLVNNAFDLGDATALSLVSEVANDNDTTSEILANELIVYALFTGKDTSEMIDIIDTLYEKYNTSLIVKAVTNALGVSNES